MSDFLGSLKADLTDRRLLPLVALVGAMLIAAIAYAALGGGGSSAAPSPTPGPVPGPVGGLAVSQAQAGSNQAVAETTGGATDQRRGLARDPFAKLPGELATTAKTTTVRTATATASTAGSGSGTAAPSTASSGGSSKPTETHTAPAPPKPAPAKPKQLFTVALELGPLTPTPQLQPYVGLTKATPLPSAKHKIVEYIGVTVSSHGKSATFALGGEVILHGSATCLPSPTQCNLIDLKEGHSEQLEVVGPTGALEAWELKVVSIASAKASSAAVARVLQAQAGVARTLGPGTLSAAGIRFSRQAGLLVFGTRHAFGGGGHGR
jgi:hypothetical protein